MGFEIDFLPVGEGERGGDAIAIRWGNLHGERSGQKIIVIDGGTKEAGKSLVEHIKKYYKTTQVDYVFCSHPDADHASGLTEVINNLAVGVLCLHRPWEHAQDFKNMFQNGKITGTGLKTNLKKALEDAYELESLAKQKNIRIYEPFADDFTDTNAEIVVLSPTKDFYSIMLANFRETPQPKESLSLPEKIITAVKEAIKWVVENWGVETLTDPQGNGTSAENNSSVIMLLQIEGKKFLFTGDAGVEALNEAIKKAVSLGIDLKTLNFIQIPHHGSKHNIGPSLLNSLIGEKLQNPAQLKTAFVSSPKEGDPKHPSRKVVNAFIRRGAKVLASKDSAKCHFENAPDRGWRTAEPLPFYDKVAE
ncbi:MAG: MBL fold metallo-hydrolase [Nanoarchaeota archaeon]|nr:MBL fold metallo-hydrolase [Nanoarchaeota archaeon]